MENLWNLKELPLPSIASYKATSCDIDIHEFLEVCENFKNLLTSQTQLHSEFLILSRITYRMKQKFRTSKDFKALEKLTKSLARYFEMNLPGDVQKLIDLIPEDYLDELYLPTKNLSEYILVRLQGVVKLFEYIMKISLDIAFMLNIRMQTGHFWKIGFILFSMVSRIYVLSRHIIKTTCNFYLKLYSISSKLIYVGKRWLPLNYTFPDNLESWLDVDIKKMDTELQQMQEPAGMDILHYFDLVEDSDDEVEFTEVITDIEKVNIVNGKNKNLTGNIVGSLTSREDIGEVIEVLSDDNDVKNNVPRMTKLQSKDENKYVDKKIMKKKEPNLEYKRNVKNNHEIYTISNRKKITVKNGNNNTFEKLNSEDIGQVIEISDDNSNMDITLENRMIKTTQNSPKTIKSLRRNEKKKKNFKMNRKIKRNIDLLDNLDNDKVIKSNIKQQKIPNKMHKQHMGSHIDKIVKNLAGNNENKHFFSVTRPIQDKTNIYKKIGIKSKEKNKKTKKREDDEQKSVFNINKSKLEKYEKIKSKKRAM